MQVAGRAGRPQGPPTGPKHGNGAAVGAVIARGKRMRPAVSPAPSAGLPQAGRDRPHVSSGQTFSAGSTAENILYGCKYHSVRVFLYIGCGTFFEALRWRANPVHRVPMRMTCLGRRAGRYGRNCRAYNFPEKDMFCFQTCRLGIVIFQGILKICRQ